MPSSVSYLCELYARAIHETPDSSGRVFRILNMRSGPVPPGGSPSPSDDRTTRARIRDAAIDCLAEHGTAGTTVRMIAAAAGVSPGLVIHHFGSMGGLRAECDGHVVASIRRAKQGAMAAGPGLDVLATIRGVEMGPAAAYLARLLVEGSEAAEGLVDGLVDDAEEYLEQGVESGLLRPTGDPRGRAAVLALWSLGALALHHHVRRILGVDLTDPGILTDPTIASYLGPASEILGDGIFTEAAAGRLKVAAAEIAAAGSEPHHLPGSTEGHR